MNGIVYHIDNTYVSMREIRILGWAISKKGKPLNFNCSKRSMLETSVRQDVNKIHDKVKEDALSGFEVTIKAFFRARITISDGEKEEVIKINCFKQKIKYIIATFKKVIRKIRSDGFFKALKLIKRKVKSEQEVLPVDNYMEWRKTRIATTAILSKQKKKKFQYQPKISIVVPTYNTPINFLCDMIDSVINQSYTNWELCIADGNSSNKETINTLNKYADKYPNIVVNFLQENKMISRNTNEGLKLVTGDYIGLLDHDDLLEPDALFEIVSLLNKKEYDMIYSDEDKTNEDASLFFTPHYKPDFSQFTLRSYNYITHFTVIKKEIMDKVGEFDYHCDGAQDFDMFLRVSDETKNIGHISKVLYNWRVHENSTAASADAKDYVINAGILALEKHLKRCNIKGKVTNGLFATSYKIDYAIENNPLVSIVIPSKDHIDDLKKCLKSIKDKTRNTNYEIIIVENNSEDNETFTFYDKINNKDNIKVLKWEKEFNYSAINNFGVKYAKGEYILLLNNDVEIINKDWLNEMLMLATQENVGTVGAKLYFDDNTIQHAGIIMGIGGVAGHSHKYFDKESFGYFGRLKVVQNLSAVTAACLLIKKSVYEEVGGLDETFKVAFNDVDFCMKVLAKGYHNIFTPYAQLYHYESKSRGLEDTEEKIKRFNSEIMRFKDKWGLWMEDPYYNLNLSNMVEDFSLREK